MAITFGYIDVLRVPHKHSGKKPIEPFSSFRPPLREWVRGQGRLHGRTPVPSAAASDRGAVWRIRSTWPSQQLRSRLTPPKWAKKGPHRESPHWASNNSLVNPYPYTLVFAFLFSRRVFLVSIPKPTDRTLWGASRFARHEHALRFGQDSKNKNFRSLRMTRQSLGTPL